MTTGEGSSADISPCVFCDYAGPSPILHDFGVGQSIVFEPLKPVTPGHVLIVPKHHTEAPFINTQCVISAAWGAAWYVRLARLDSYNLILSVGKPATQTVKHLHMHVVPRREGDGLKLPWTEA